MITNHEIEVVNNTLITRILEAIEEHYDLHYGETYIDPIDFYYLVEEFYIDSKEN